MNNKKKLVKENWKSALLIENASIQDAMLNIEKTSLKISIIVDEENKLIGTVSDGDIRRGLLDGLSLTSNINKIINKNPLFVKSNLSNEEVTKLMKSTSLFQIPIVDKNLRVVGMHLLNENSETKIKENIVLIMAGGMGDVLSGIISSFMAQKMTLFNAACLGVYLHAEAADEYADALGENGLTPTDVLEIIKELV